MKSKLVLIAFYIFFTLFIFAVIGENALLAWSLLISGCLAALKVENQTTTFQLHCFRSLEIGPLIRHLAPNEIENVCKIDLKVKYKKKTQDTREMKKRQFIFLYTETTGYLIFKDGSYKKTTEEKSLRDLEAEGSKEVGYYALVTTQGSSCSDTKYTKVYICSN